MDPTGATPLRNSRRTGDDDRRSSRRFALSLTVRWRIRHNSHRPSSGTGKTINLSSSGVLLQSSPELPVGAPVEVSIAWPILLRDVAPLQLRIAGEVARVAGCYAAIRIQHYEFRTVGVALRTSLQNEGPSEG